MKIKLKKKINWLNILLIILITALLILFFIAETKNCEEYKGSYKIYTIIPGDTVYSIAKDLNTNENLNKVIYQIRQDNNITDCDNLKIGQEIKIREVWD